MSTKQMVRLALLAGFGVLLMYAVAFPLPFFPEFLTYDPGDIPALIAAFAVGPWAGVLVQLLKNVITFLIGGSKAGIIGVTANFIAGGTMALVAGLVYSLKKTRGMAVIGLLAGVVTTTLVMGAVNYFWLLPLWGVPANQVLPMLTGAVLPFNAVKFSLSSVVTFALYKKVKSIIEVEKYDPVVENKQ
ncbi:MAG: ECF transporter S component [Bacillota bacterium]|uniref:Riboflavin transporter n=1 Tax=Thermanaerosceptrum fracticalcis TaxID=1712410 RepID=A0A7G6E1X9_THEFR|nr:ECF transporter S component [Thermanaerosceptrum fracticalcis]QNB46083.1 ECF transporter S component [Thermanaerosceptrum fracticalcis]